MRDNNTSAPAILSPPLALGISVVGKSQIFDENKRVNEFSIEIGYIDINARVAKKLGI